MNPEAATFVCGASTQVKRVGDRLHARCPRCKCWDCDECAPVRLKQLRAILIHGQPDAMLTFALKPREGESHEKAAYRLKAEVRRAIRLLRKETKTKFAYAEVGEHHKDGRLHVHVLVRGWKYFHHEKLKALWLRITGDSWTANIDRIDPGRAVHYVTKYLTKAPAKWGRLKRYVISRGWPRREKTEQPAADKFMHDYIVSMSLAAWVAHIVARGGLVESREGRLAIVRAPP